MAETSKEFDLSPKQYEYLIADDKRLNFLVGSVRSGKTFVSLLKFCLWVRSQPKDREFIMIGKTVGSLERNCFDYIFTFFGERNFQFSKSSKHATLFGRRIWLEGANDNRSENKIRGMTLAGAYCDEVTLYPENFFIMLLTRLSMPGAKLTATCNPDNPLHYIKKNYIDRADELDAAVWNFLLTDNRHLGQEYIDSISKEFSGVFYDRYILGQWVKAGGLVYPMFDESVNVVNDDEPGAENYISIDYGTLNPTAMGLWRMDGETSAVMVKEYYYNGRDEQLQKTDEEYYRDLEKFAGNANINYVIIDPSAASFRECIRRHGRFRVRNADNSVLDGIRLTGSLLQAGALKFDRKCENTFEEFYVYSWDEESAEDVVVKEDDHCMDQMRYFVQTIMRRKIRTQG